MTDWILGFLGKNNKLHKNKIMEKTRFSLESNISNRITRIFQLLFGIICIIVAFIWLFLNFSTLSKSGALWITIFFLLAFGYFQIISGLGRAEKFIEINQPEIRIKRNSLLPPSEIKSSEIQKIEIYPLSLVFFTLSGRSVILRFGTTSPDINEQIKESIENFCNINHINLEIKREYL